VERRRVTERERSKNVRSMPGRKRERDNHKKKRKQHGRERMAILDEVSKPRHKRRDR